MSKPIYRYTIHRIGVKRALQKGELRAKSIDKVAKKIQRRIRKAVLRQKMSLIVRIWNIEKKRDTFKQRYTTKHDFRRLRKPPKWRQELSRKAKYSSTYDPTPDRWFVAIGKKRRGIKELVLTKLAYDPAKKTLLRRKRRKLIGPFETEELARQFKEGVEQRVEAARVDKTIVERRGEQ